MTTLAYPSAQTTALALATDGDRPLARFITHRELVDLLSGIRGASIVTIEAKTEPKMLAKHPTTGQPNPLKNNVVKISLVNGIIGWQYQRCVNRERCREDLTPDFEALPRKWGTRLPHSPLVLHNGAYYVELKIERSLGYRYETFNGQSLSADAVQAYLPQRKVSRQGVEHEVILRDYAIENIISIRMGGTNYFIRSAGEVAESSAAAARLSA